MRPIKPMKKNREEIKVYAYRPVATLMIPGGVKNIFWKP